MADLPPCILVVDDNDVNLELVQEILSTRNYRVITARNGQEAVQKAKQNRPNLILMDIRMPVMSGLEATEKLRGESCCANIPVIALTASVGTDAERRQIAVGCNFHLEKPVQSKVLFKAIERYLGPYTSE